jgi:hypothetical protein
MKINELAAVIGKLIIAWLLNRTLLQFPFAGRLLFALLWSTRSWAWTKISQIAPSGEGVCGRVCTVRVRVLLVSDYWPYHNWPTDKYQWTFTFLLKYVWTWAGPWKWYETFLLARSNSNQKMASIFFQFGIIYNPTFHFQRKLFPFQSV